MRESDPENRPAESPVLELLVGYRAVLQRAEALPLFVWMHSRPSRLSTTSRLKLPRLTLGASILVRHHILRSVDALLREYAARAALRELDAVGVRDRAALTDFRASVRPVPWRRIIVSVVLAALILGRGMVELLIGSLRELAFGLTQFDLDQEARLRATADALLTLSSSLSASSVSGTASQLANAGPGALAVLAGGLLASAYLVLRPFASAFRIKRILFNLSSTPELQLTDTCTTWHVTRSVGMYDAERNVLRDVDVPREKPFDLMLSVIALTLICTATASVGPSDEGWTRSDSALYVLVVLAPVLMRLLWLVRTYRDRSDGTTGRELPQYCRLPETGHWVDRRPVSESMAWSFLFLAPFVWFRLGRQTDRLMFEDATHRYFKPKLRGPWLAFGSAILMYLVPPVALLSRVVRMHRMPSLQWSDYAFAAALLPVWVSWYWAFLVAEPGSTGEMVGFLVTLGVPALAIGLGQHIANRQVVALGGDEISGGRSVHVESPEDNPLRFNPPPGWPAPPHGWSPASSWHPDASWPTAPAGWRFWVAAD